MYFASSCRIENARLIHSVQITLWSGDFSTFGGCLEVNSEVVPSTVEHWVVTSITWAFRSMSVGIWAPNFHKNTDWLAKARQDFEILHIISNLHATIPGLKYLKIILKTSVLLSGKWKLGVFFHFEGSQHWDSSVNSFPVAKCMLSLWRLKNHGSSIYLRLSKPTNHFKLSIWFSKESKHGAPCCCIRTLSEWIQREGRVFFYTISKSNCQSINVSLQRQGWGTTRRKRSKKICCKM